MYAGIFMTDPRQDEILLTEIDEGPLYRLSAQGEATRCVALSRPAGGLAGDQDEISGSLIGREAVIP
jgi:hypothetical protein